MAPKSEPSGATVVKPNNFMEHFSSRNERRPNVPTSEFHDQCRAIAEHVVGKSFNNTRFRRLFSGPIKRYGDKMVKLTEDMRTKHELLFRGMAGRLELKTETVAMVFKDVAEQIFIEDFNFGRVVSLYAFLVTMVKYCIDNDQSDKIQNLIDMTASALVKREQQFLESGGWDGFLLHFTDNGDRLWRGILVTTISLGALATLLYART